MTDISVFSFSVIDEMVAKISVSTLWIVFAVFSALVLMMSFALSFHWSKYKLHSPATYIAQGIYFVGLLILLVLCGMSLVR